GNAVRYYETPPDRPASLERIPMNQAGYYGEDRSYSQGVLDVLQATATLSRLYRQPGGHASDLFIGYFKSQKFGASIHSPKHCLPGGGWRIERHQSFTLPLADGSTKEVNRLVISHNNQASVMLYWFETRSGAVRSEYGLKFDLFKNSLLMQPTDAAFVRITVAANNGDLKAANEAGVEFIQTFHDDIMAALPF
ncbi:EpsI family protein, partial [candidate division GN15 bacterium]|nr:EpsI family protein [candidate division GN15 bacterium]